ncbi:MAG TPA: hypothetical protein V6C96_04005 [Vampirovibrionales bacterium]
MSELNESFSSKGLEVTVKKNPLEDGAMVIFVDSVTGEVVTKYSAKVKGRLVPMLVKCEKIRYEFQSASTYLLDRILPGKINPLLKFHSQTGGFIPEGYQLTIKPY